MPPSRHDTPISAGDCKPWLILPRRFQFRMLGALCYRFRVSAFYTPQFNLAEYAGPDICQYCRRPISGTYYRVRATMACPECTNKIRAAMAQNDSSPYPFALVCGIGAAIVGMILYSAFTILTGWIVSYVSLAVGWMVGTAIKKGSGGSGGRRYQITAALLTYAAISMSALPTGIHYARQHQRALLRAQTLGRSFRPERPLTPEQHEDREQDLAARQRQLEDEFGQPHSNRLSPRPHPSPPPADPSNLAAQPGPSSRVATPPQGSPPQVLQTQTVPADGQQLNSFAFAQQLLWLTIGSPLALFWLQGLTLGVVLNVAILSVGIVFAWRLAAGVNLVIYGPFEAPRQPTR
jgi:hypothetical protein